MLKQKLLVAGAKKTLSSTLSKILEGIPCEASFLTLDAIRSKLALEAPDCLLLVAEEDCRETTAKIESLIQWAKRYDDNLPIVVISHSEKVQEVVRFMRLGVYDYFTSPAESARLQRTLQNAFRLYQLTKRVFLLENQLGFQTKLDEMVGSAPSMQILFKVIQNVAKTNATVLILGESGTGKELVAKAIHRLSPRNPRRFIDINCGAIPRELLENELFGHERGAYTGADKRYIGCCERSDGGTLFLDEISEMDPSLQVKLLRFLQERQFFRVGGSEPIRVDTRIVAATNRNLAELVSKNQFREDLYYRLNVVPISLPPLRERGEDIPLLAKHFLDKYTHRNEKIFLDFTPEVMEALIRYDWPGNIRELENTIERAVVLHNDTKVKLAYLPQPIRDFKIKAADDGEGEVAHSEVPEATVLPLTLVERYAIESALKICTGNVAMAARRLKIGPATLYRKMRQYGIRL